MPNKDDKRYSSVKYQLFFFVAVQKLTTKKF